MNGIIIIDKPAGRTSHDVVREVRRTLGVKKAGHTGTLDPLATGVLPVCLDEGTKLAQFFCMDMKEYRATMLLGVTTDTYDVEGTIVAEERPVVSRKDIEKALLSLVGKRKQVPPPYSAVKHQGKPLYRWARKGIPVVSPPRPIEIFRISLEELALPYVTFEVVCSKGTYIRSICLEIGEMLGCGACLAGLRRTKSGFYSEKQACCITGEEGEEKKEALSASIISLADALPDFPALRIDRPLAEKIRQGYQLAAGALAPYDIPSLDAGDMLRLIYDRELVAVARMLYQSECLPGLLGQEQAMKILRVFTGG